MARDSFSVPGIAWQYPWNFGVGGRSGRYVLGTSRYSLWGLAVGRQSCYVSRAGRYYPWIYTVGWCVTHFFLADGMDVIGHGVLEQVKDIQRMPPIHPPKELLSSKRNPDHAKLYTKYFEINETPVRGVSLVPKQDAINAVEKNHGYFALISNGVKDPLEALDIYRSKDVVEKAFGNLKERLNMRRTSVSSEENLEGKLFIQFIALIYLSYISKAMNTNQLDDQKTNGSIREFGSQCANLGIIHRESRFIVNCLSTC